jgi:hypothetical protein
MKAVSKRLQRLETLLGITTPELAARIAQGRIGSVLLDRFREPGATTDNTN